MRAPELDELDRQVLAALQANARASWPQVARALGVNESTVARRASRLFESGSVRVIGVVDVLRCGVGIPALVRLRCAPGRSNETAERVAARDDVRFAAVVTGGADVLAEVVLDRHEAAATVIDEQIGTLPGVVATETAFVLSTFTSVHDWGGHLLPEAGELRHDVRAPEPTPPAPHQPFTPVERRLIDALAGNGRLSYASLAQQAGISESMARRRTEGLVDRGCLRFRTLVEPALLGYQVEFFLWSSVEPAELAQTCRQLAGCPDVRYLSAVTGTHNVAAQVALPRYQEVFGFLGGVVGELPGVRTVDTMMQIRVLKRAFAAISDAATVGPAVRPPNRTGPRQHTGPTSPPSQSSPSTRENRSA